MSNYPPTVAAQPTTTANPLLQRHQSEQRRRELPKIVETESTSMDITIGQSKQPQFLKSIDELAAFSVAVETFKRQFDDLQKHIESIENAIDSKLESNGVVLAARNNNFHQPMLSHPRNNVSVETTVTVSQPSQEIVPETSNKPEGGRMCELMCSKGLRKYIYANISDQAKLMEEIPSALKLAKEPAKFVLDCIGKFYLQGRRAFTKESPMSSARQVSLLILESFLLMPDRGKGKVKIESWIKDEAETAAVAWRKRLMTEGGLAAAEKMDARGLLLLVACFGVPSNFRSTDLLDLIRMSGSNEIAGALKRSQFLVPMVSGIVESSIKRGMHIEALEMVYTFGMEDKFSAALVLTSFLKMSKESFERAKRKAQSPLAFKEAATKQLAVLSSVMQCMETHNLMEEAALAKRMYNQQIKRPRLSPMEMPPVTSSSYSPIYRDRSFPSQRDDDQDEISALVSSYLGPSTSFPHRSRRSPEYMVPLPHGGLGRSVTDIDFIDSTLRLWFTDRDIHYSTLLQFMDNNSYHMVYKGFTDIHHLKKDIWVYPIKGLLAVTHH
ncbi:unnamed protein product [Arabidopsis thaliana]|uniref:FRIGIDA-like protein n=1 Tax=Arabidopsis thaliana TaxID=3702 RepID=A0A654FKP0_ARATH|nr:unnamed protein product [Arabidopsis thaliana]